MDPLIEALAAILPPLTPEEDDYVQHKIRSAKRSARSELSVTGGEWAKHNYAKTDILSTKGLKDNVQRIHISDLSAEQFVQAFEAPRQPIVITGLTDVWPATEQWSPQALLQQFRDHKFKVGSDDDGYAVRLRLEHFLRYCVYHHHGGADDSPLYIFDGTFAERSGSAAMSQQYAVPQLFQEDLFQLAGEKRRPPYRWFVMGPARSGTGLHIDPLATSAWNALLAGHKRWALFPPHTPREHLLPKEPGLEREAVSWFSRIYPRTQQPDWPTAKPLDIIQRPGETVFVPHGWWHAVLNLDLTIAVTHNYASSSNFPTVWRHARKGRPKMSIRWLAALRQQRPDLAAIADEIDSQGKVQLSNSSSTSSSSSSSSSGSGSSSSSSDSEDEHDSGKAKKRRKAADGSRAPLIDAAANRSTASEKQQPAAEVQQAANTAATADAQLDGRREVATSDAAAAGAEGRLQQQQQASGAVEAAAAGDTPQDATPQDAQDAAADTVGMFKSSAVKACRAH